MQEFSIRGRAKCNMSPLNFIGFYLTEVYFPFRHVSSVAVLSGLCT